MLHPTPPVPIPQRVKENLTSPPGGTDVANEHMQQQHHVSALLFNIPFAWKASELAVLMAPPLSIVESKDVSGFILALC